MTTVAPNAMWRRFTPLDMGVVESNFGLECIAPCTGSGRRFRFSLLLGFEAMNNEKKQSNPELPEECSVPSKNLPASFHLQIYRAIFQSRVYPCEDNTIRTVYRHVWGRSTSMYGTAPFPFARRNSSPSRAQLLDSVPTMASAWAVM